MSKTNIKLIILIENNAINLKNLKDIHYHTKFSLLFMIFDYNYYCDHYFNDHSNFNLTKNYKIIDLYSYTYSINTNLLN